MFRAAAFAVLAVVAATNAGAGASDPVSSTLASFDFDGPAVETGPYTLIAYENARGSVGLTSQFRHSGTRSVEIRDVAGDGDFAELQGFFREMPAGIVYFHFALMLAEPLEPMNVAVAGAGHFAIQKDGFGFRLRNEGGTLYHVTEGKDVALFKPRAFTWYVTDIAYDIDAGRYDLQIVAEGEKEPVVSLRSVPNPMGLRRSKVHKFSFIGDPPGLDRSNARFYVDDIVVRADRPVADDGPFVAPGRRMLFVDVYRYYRSLLYEKPGCLPSLGPEDFGLTSVDLHDLAEAGRMRLYDELADRRFLRPPSTVAGLARDRLAAMALWGQGCAAGCRGACSLPFFEKAHAQVPEAKLYPLSRVFALAAEKRWDEADALFVEIYPEWRGDPRFPAVSALLGIARGDLDEAERALSSASDRDPSPAELTTLRRLLAGELDQSLIRDLQAAFPTTWSEHVEAALASEHRYYLLIWQERYDEARRLADRKIEQLRSADVSPAAWLERRGDALFWSGDIRGAGQSYEEAIGGLRDPAPVYAKLSDVHFALGDTEGERSYREKVYGSLRR